VSELSTEASRSASENSVDWLTRLEQRLGSVEKNVYGAELSAMTEHASAHGSESSFQMWRSSSSGPFGFSSSSSTTTASLRAVPKPEPWDSRSGSPFYESSSSGSRPVGAFSQSEPIGMASDDESLGRRRAESSSSHQSRQMPPPRGGSESSQWLTFRAGEWSGSESSRREHSSEESSESGVKRVPLRLQVA